MKFKNTIIQTERLVLRPLSPRYFKSTCCYACDRENTHFMIYLSGATRFSVLKFLFKTRREWKKKNPNFFEFAVIEKSTGQHIGGVGLSREIIDGEKMFEIGWVLAKDFHGKGYCTEAARALIDWGKNFLNVNKIIAHADEGNAPSINVMKKLGMRQCGVGRRVYKDGRTVNEVIYTIIIAILE